MSKTRRSGFNPLAGGYTPDGDPRESLPSAPAGHSGESQNAPRTTQAAPIVLGLDPSSTRTGYAMLSGLRCEELLDAGYLRPHRVRDSAIDRIRAMRDDTYQLIHADTQVIAIETPTPGGKRYARRRGQAQYGVAVGVMLGVAWQWRDEYPYNRIVAPIAADVWTGGKPKSSRRPIIEALYPQIRQALADQDDGGDIADAIGVARYYLEDPQAWTPVAKPAQ